ncbi:hypothetical protein HYQ46_000015 [Verticillium longisporum]|nr:hypothetical protein HYQ46_000015 [Verticillium longisporum]
MRLELAAVASATLSPARHDQSAPPDAQMLSSHHVTSADSMQDGVQNHHHYVDPLGSTTSAGACLFHQPVPPTRQSPHGKPALPYGVSARLGWLLLLSHLDDVVRCAR